MKLHTIILVSFLALSSCNNESSSSTQYANKIVFKDTVGYFAFDSVTHNLGVINSDSIKKQSLVKYFEYFGNDSVMITQTWTGDPHFICKYPKEVLQPHKLYSFSVCFYHEGKRGKLSKRMGFDFTNGEKVELHFKGIYTK